MQNTEARKAFDELKNLGVPVVDIQEDGSYFRISGEDNEDTVWADYYNEYRMSYSDDFGVHEEINNILNKHGLYAEWYNPGYLHVYNA